MNAMTRRIMRGCAIFMTLAAVGIVFAYGFTWWSIAGALLLLACPVAVLWGIARLDEDLPRQEGFPPPKDRHEARTP